MTFTVTWYPRIWSRTERTGGWFAGRVSCFKSFIVLPHFLALSLWPTSYARPSTMSSRHPNILWYLPTNNTICCVTIRVCNKLRIHVRLGSAGAFPPCFRRLSATSRQPFHRLLHRPAHPDFLGNPHVLHRICDDLSCAKSADKRSTFSSAFSCDFRPRRAD